MQSKIIAFLLFLLYAMSPALANPMQVPVEVQGPLFIKVLGFEKNHKFRVKKTIKLGVFYTKSSQSTRVKKDILNSLKKLQKRNKTIGKLSFSIQEIPNQKILKVKDMHILYITPDSNAYLKSIQQISRKNKVITITGVPEYVKAGQVSIGASLKKRNGKMFPNIMINLKVAQAEGSDFSSKLLQIAELIK